jgi:hypothetical protein
VTPSDTSRSSRGYLPAYSGGKGVRSVLLQQGQAPFSGTTPWQHPSQMWVALGFLLLAHVATSSEAQAVVGGGGPTGKIFAVMSPPGRKIA